MMFTSPFLRATIYLVLFMLSLLLSSTLKFAPPFHHLFCLLYAFFICIILVPPFFYFLKFFRSVFISICLSLLWSTFRYSPSYVYYCERVKLGALDAKALCIEEDCEEKINFVYHQVYFLFHCEFKVGADPSVSRRCSCGTSDRKILLAVTLSPKL